MCSVYRFSVIFKMAQSQAWFVCQQNDNNPRISSETGLPHDNISLSLCLISPILLRFSMSLPPYLILHILLQFVIIKQVCLPLKYGWLQLFEHIFSHTLLAQPIICQFRLNLLGGLYFWVVSTSSLFRFSTLASTSWTTKSLSCGQKIRQLIGLKST